MFTLVADWGIVPYHPGGSRFVLKNIILMEQLLYLALSLLLCSCGTMRHTQMQVAERIHKDTVYLSNIQYDSIYIYNNVYQDRSRDTITITGYRYNLLRDTVKVVQRDSIPYEVRVVEVKEVRYIPPWIKIFTEIGAIAAIVLSCYFIIKMLL